jgi:hypothetical protein
MSAVWWTEHVRGVWPDESEYGVLDRVGRVQPPGPAIERHVRMRDEPLEDRAQ